MLETGATPEGFTLKDQQGEDVAWDSFRGKPVVFFFYPKANTPGCTKEACAFRDLAADFDARGVQVVGVSADSVRKQSNFTKKYDLTMPLLSDPDRVILDAWGVWGEKKMYGKTYEGIHRSTFLFDADGTLVHVWPKVKVKGHAEDVLAKVDAHFGEG
jgi:thioredoxin-dependent peroxiredoxin